MACSPGHAMAGPAWQWVPSRAGREEREAFVHSLPFTHGVGTVHEATQRGSLSRVVQTCLAPLLTRTPRFRFSLAARWNHFRKVDSLPSRAGVLRNVRSSARYSGALCHTGIVGCTAYNLHPDGRSGKQLPRMYVTLGRPSTAMGQTCARGLTLSTFHEHSTTNTSPSPPLPQTTTAKSWSRRPPSMR